MYASLLKLIRSLRRWKRRAVKVLGKSIFSALWEIAEHVLEFLKNLSGIGLIVPIIAFFSVPVHFTSKDFSWKSTETSPFPNPTQFLLGITGIAAAMVLRLGIKGAWLKSFGLLLAASILSPIWLLALSALVLLVANIWRLVVVEFIYQRSVSAGHYMDESNYRVLFSVHAWRRIDWSKFYYFLCYFWVYAAVTLTIIGTILLVLLFLWNPQFFIELLIKSSGVDASYPSPGGIVQHFSVPPNLDLFSTIYRSWPQLLFPRSYSSWRVLTQLVPFLVILPSVRYFLRPYLIMFCNCLKIPTVLSFDTQFRELNERSRLLLQARMSEDVKMRLVERLRASTRAAIRAVRRQERRARKWNLTETYLEERTVYGLDFRAVTSYLDRKRDWRLLYDIERILAGRPLLQSADEYNSAADQPMRAPSEPDGNETRDRDTPGEQISSRQAQFMRSSGQVMDQRPPGLTEVYEQVIRLARESKRFWIALAMAPLLIIGLVFSGLDDWVYEKYRKYSGNEVKDQITEQNRALAQRFFNDINSGKNPCFDSLLAPMIPEAQKCDKALESCYHVPHKDICADPSVSLVFPDRGICDGVASATYPVCPPTNEE
jgi:hypothetical protein